MEGHDREDTERENKQSGIEIDAGSSVVGTVARGEWGMGVRDQMRGSQKVTRKCEKSGRNRSGRQHRP